MGAWCPRGCAQEPRGYSVRNMHGALLSGEGHRAGHTSTLTMRELQGMNEQVELAWITYYLNGSPKQRR